MPINLGKTKFMVFSKRPTNEIVTVKCQMKQVDGTIKTLNIDRTNQERILGVFYDEQMTFLPHLDKIFTSSINNINKIRDFIYKQGGLSTPLAIMLYTAYVRTLIESSYPAWCTINEDALKRIDTIQGIALKMILQLKGQTSYNAQDVEAGVLPIRLRMKQILALFGCKLLRKEDNNKLKSIMTNNLERKNIGKSVTTADKIRMAMNTTKRRDVDFTLIEKEPNMAMQYESDITPNLFVWRNHGNSSSRTKEQREDLRRKTAEFLMTIDTDDIVCFTDGSVANPDKNGMGPCGAGVVIYQNGLNNDPTINSIKVSKRSTSYHGEIAAIKECLLRCEVLNRKKHRANIYIISDCQSAIQAILSNKAPDSHIKEIETAIRSAKEISKMNTNIKLSWIGGHIDILGNDIADKAAKEGAMRSDLSSSNTMTLKAVKQIILEATLEKWQKAWDLSNTGKHMKEIETTVSTTVKHSLPPSRLMQKTFHQLRGGPPNDQVWKRMR